MGFWDVDHYVKISYALSGTDASGHSFWWGANREVVMGCHQWNGWKHPGRRPEDSPPCGGWTRVVGAQGAAVAGLLRAGRIHEADITPGPLAGALYPDVTTMVRWNGVRVDALPALDDARMLFVLRYVPSDHLVVQGSPLSYGYRDMGDGSFLSKMPRLEADVWRHQMEEADQVQR